MRYFRFAGIELVIALTVMTGIINIVTTLNSPPRVDDVTVERVLDIDGNVTLEKK